MRIEKVNGQQTRLHGDWGADFWEPLKRASFAEESWAAAESLQLMTMHWEGDPPQPPTKPLDQAPPDDWFDDPPRPGHFYGWVREPAPAPYFTPPVPLDLRTLGGAGASPIAGLEPWLEKVRITERSGPAVTGCTAESLSFRTLAPPAKGWERLHVPGDVRGGQMRVFPEHLELSLQVSRTERRVKGPGFVGSFVPGYSQARSLASTASAVTHEASVGCEIDLAFVSAVRAKTTSTTERVLIGKKHNQLVEERGYGSPDSWEIHIELSDGWRPLSVLLLGGYLEVEREDEPLTMASWLVQHIAHHRLHAVGLEPAQRETLEGLRTDGAAFGSFAEGRHRSEWISVDLPASRPISVELPTD